MNTIGKTRLNDGTDISRMTADQIAVHQRRLSPKFPSIEEALVRRQRLHETIAARVLFAGMILGGLDAMIEPNRFGWVAAGFCFVGFVVTCFVAGAREQERNRFRDVRHRSF